MQIEVFCSIVFAAVRRRRAVLRSCILKLYIDGFAKRFGGISVFYDALSELAVRAPDGVGRAFVVCKDAPVAHIEDDGDEQTTLLRQRVLHALGLLVILGAFYDVVGFELLKLLGEYLVRNVIRHKALELAVPANAVRRTVKIPENIGLPLPAYRGKGEVERA